MFCIKLDSFFPHEVMTANALVVTEPLDWVPFFHFFSFMRSFLARSVVRNPTCRTASFLSMGPGRMGVALSPWVWSPHFISIPQISDSTGTRASHSTFKHRRVFMDTKRCLSVYVVCSCTIEAYSRLSETSRLFSPLDCSPTASTSPRLRFFLRDRAAVDGIE